MSFKNLVKCLSFLILCHCQSQTLETAARDTREPSSHDSLLDLENKNENTGESHEESEPQESLLIVPTKAPPVKTGSLKVISPLPSYTRSMIQSKDAPQCRKHPIQKIFKTHAGCDFNARKGSPIVNILPGIVISAARDGSYGNLVTVEHTLENGKKIYSRYAHMSVSSSCPMAKPGTKVKAGDKLGCVGSTGSSTGPHLHFEIRSSATGGDIYDSKFFLLNNGKLKEATTC